jgi:hypothetical protein
VLGETLSLWSNDPNTHNNKLVTYHSWFAIPFSTTEPMPNTVSSLICPNMLCTMSGRRLRLRAHILKVEAAAWLELQDLKNCSRVRSQVTSAMGNENGVCPNEAHVLLFFCKDWKISILSVYTLF